MTTDQELGALVPFVLIHAQGEAPRECCGLAVREAAGDRLTYLACANLARHSEHFVLSPADFARAEDTGEIVAVVHSHVFEPPVPSAADLTGIERTGLPWLIVNHPVGTYTVTYPSGYTAPLIGRNFVHGVHDCYGLVRDYYALHGVVLNDYARTWGWWEDTDGPDLYRDNFASEGFIQIASTYEDAAARLREHDLILMRIRAPRENHMAVYLGNSVILHHLIGQLSRREVYQEFYQRRTTAVLRHRAFMPEANNHANGHLLR
jgi:proteasome lid subunit RPN8/RPN11